MTRAEKRELTALAPLASKLPPPSDPTSGGGKRGKPIAHANIELELPEFDPKNLPEWAEEFPEFLLLTDQSHVDVTTKGSLTKHSCKKKLLQKQVKQIVETCSAWAEVLQRPEKTFPVYETDLSVRPQIEELPMLPEFPSAACISEYVCELEYVFSRMNVGSYGPKKPHLWLVGKIPFCTWDDCRSISERKRRTDRMMTWWTCSFSLLSRGRRTPIWKNSSRGRGGKVPTPILIVVSREGAKPPLTPVGVEVKGGVTYMP